MLRLISSSSSSKFKPSKSLLNYSLAVPLHQLSDTAHYLHSSSHSAKPVKWFSSTGLSNSKGSGWFWCGQGSMGGVRSFSGESVTRECLSYDVVIVGAGPAGLSAAIRLKQLCKQKDVDLSVCVVEKGAEVGAHILSGNVFEPRALDELLPNWKQEEAPIHVPVSSDKFWLLSKTRAFPFPSPFNNRGNYVISLSQLVRWLGVKAEELGVEIYPGFAASEILYDTTDKVIGIATNDMGVAKDGSKKDNFQPGVELKGRVTLFAEGCRGSLSEKVIKRYNLRDKGQGQHQTYALGIKEVWGITDDKHHAGTVLHTIGWPLDPKTYGGSFLYHMKDRQVAIGLVVALNYRNPFLNPYEEFQSTHLVLAAASISNDFRMCLVGSIFPLILEEGLEIFPLFTRNRSGRRRDKLAKSVYSQNSFSNSLNWK